MKSIKYILLLIIAGLASSCEEFLEEDPISLPVSDKVFGSPEGLTQLVNATYASTKIWYGKEEGFDVSEIGTDIFTYAEQSTDPDYFQYGSTHSSRKGRLAILWVEFYAGINACNEALYYLESESPFSADVTRRYIAEVKFMRSFYLYHLTEHWGRVPMPLQRNEGPVTQATLFTPTEVYDQILTDVNYVIDSLRDDDYATDADWGRVTRDAAIAFRARLALTIASYIDYTGNDGLFSFPGISAADMWTSAYTDAMTLINSPDYSFHADYADLWLWDNNKQGTKNNEAIWGVNYSKEVFTMLNVDPTVYTNFTVDGKAWSEREGGHHGHMMFGMFYDIYPGMERVLEYGRQFRRYQPTKYMVDLFRDRVDYDARYEHQFQFQWDCVIPAGLTWSTVRLPDGSTPTPPAGKTGSSPLYEVGDTSIYITLDDLPDDRIAQIGEEFFYVDGPYFVLDYDLLYNADGSPNDDGTFRRQHYLSISKKFADPERAEGSLALSQRGARDAIVFRLAEMYMIAAEAAANGAGGGVAEAVTLMRTLRATRAQPGMEAQMTGEIDASDFASADSTKEFFLEERALEFCGEQLRVLDLKRTHTAEEYAARIRQYNPDVVPNMQPHHYLRPYPSKEIDAVTNKAEFGDNNGYN